MPGSPSPEGAMRRRLALDILTIAVTAALTTALVHMLVVAIQYFGIGQIVFASPDVVWMAPLAYLVIFLGVGVVLVLVGMVTPRLMPLTLACFVLMALGAVNLALPIPRVSHWGSVALALGAASVITRAFHDRPGQWLARYRLLTRVIAIVVVAVSVAMMGARWGVRWWAERSLPPAPTDRPNVLLLIWDTVRADNLSVYGYDRPTTPALEQLAAEGLAFDWAFAPAPWTLPSHASMFTGRHARELTADWWVPLDDRYPTLAERFREAGYLTAGFVANGHYTNYDSGLARGFIWYHDFRLSAEQVMQTAWIGQTVLVRRLLASRSVSEVGQAILGRNLHVPRKKDFDHKEGAAVTDDFLAWLEERGDRPYFAFLNYFDAHQPLRRIPGHTDRFGSDRPQIDLYDGALSYLDAELARLVEALRANGTLNRTIVIVTADHGELFGEHGVRGHAHNMYREVLHVPLVIRYPARVPQGERVATAVSLRDIAATIETLADMPAAGRLPGASLVATGNGEMGAFSPVVADVRGVAGADPETPLIRGSMTSGFTDAWHYIRYGDGVEELYAYRRDPQEGANLVATETTAVREMRALVEGPGAGLLPASRPPLLALDGDSIATPRHNVAKE